MAATPPAATAGAATAGTTAPKKEGPGEASSTCICPLKQSLPEQHFLGHHQPIWVPAGVLMSAGACGTAATVRTQHSCLLLVERGGPPCFAWRTMLLGSCHIAQRGPTESQVNNSEHQ